MLDYIAVSLGVFLNWVLQRPTVQLVPIWIMWNHYKATTTNQVETITVTPSLTVILCLKLLRDFVSPCGNLFLLCSLSGPSPLLREQTQLGISWIIKMPFQGWSIRGHGVGAFRYLFIWTVCWWLEWAPRSHPLASGCQTWALLISGRAEGKKWY